MKKYLFVFGIVAAVVACTPKIAEVVDTPPPPPPSEEVIEETMSDEAMVGGEIYSKKCTMCHEAKVIDNYTEAQWAGILPNMITKAKLDETKAAQVTQYVNWEMNH